jgi:urea transporter/murein DD-endopeptidase MepM/ murein hydrolase activator NlpD
MSIRKSDGLQSQSEGFLNSYSQVFFSDNPIFAFLLILVSFMDIYAGLCGALGVIISNLLASGMGFSNWLIRKGYYGYNSLLVGLGFGLTFHPGLVFFLLIPVLALLTFLFTVTFQGFFYKYRLPYLSLPFLVGIWLILLASGQFSALGLSIRGIYTFNELYSVGGQWLIDTVEWFDSLITAEGLRTYFYSLGAIFFQQNLLAGILITIGLIIYSRIAFTLSVLGFMLAWAFYRITGADVNQLSYTYIGFNYILTSIALGAFFIIPSRWSYLWLVWLLPLVIVITVSLQKLFSGLQLGVYALPFNIVVLTFLYVLKIRGKPGKRLIETVVQHFSPEKNLYHRHISQDRFLDGDYLPVSLPVLGEWTVSQSYDGEHTHKGEWAHGIDLLMNGNDGRQFRNEGLTLRDYYCYEKPVVAPADGTVADMTDGISDNNPGDNNLQRNWGNSVVLKHHDFLYSQVSHLKPGSIRIKKGDTVKRGDIIGLCGNSGRSPYPHLHFQLQATPHIGSKTMYCPLSNYLLTGENGLSLQNHSVPLTGSTIMAIQNHSLLENAFHFLPGSKITFEVSGSHLTWLKGSHEWEVKTDEYNNSYFECKRSGACAYFYNNGNIHFFTNYLGSRKSLLYYFYIGFYRVLTGFYNGLIIRDTLPPDKIFRGFRLFLQDFSAPFCIFLHSDYELTYTELEEDFYFSKALLKVSVSENGKSKSTFDIRLSQNIVSSFNYKSNSLSFSALCTGSY